jgi:hypothetical protein
MANRSTALKHPSWIAVSIPVLLLVGAPGRSAPKDEYRPGLTLDLRQLGYEEPKTFHTQAEYRALHNSAVFLDDDTLAVSLFVRNPHPGLSVRDKVLGGPYLFQTVLLDAKSGKILRTQTWSNSGIGCGLFTANNGNFVVFHGLKLSLHSSDGTLVKSGGWPRCSGARRIRVPQVPVLCVLCTPKASTEHLGICSILTTIV